MPGSITSTAAVRPRTRDTKRHDDFTGVDDRTRGDVVLRAAILFRDDRVLRHVNQTAGQDNRSWLS